MYIVTASSPDFLELISTLPPLKVGVGFAAAAMALFSWEIICTLPLSIRLSVQAKPRRAKSNRITNTCFYLSQLIFHQKSNDKDTLRCQFKLWYYCISCSYSCKLSCPKSNQLCFHVLVHCCFWECTDNEQYSCCKSTRYSYRTVTVRFTKILSLYQITRRTWCICNGDKRVLYFIIPPILFVFGTIIALFSQIRPTWIGENVQVCLPTSDLVYHVNFFYSYFPYFGTCN